MSTMEEGESNISTMEMRRDARNAPSLTLHPHATKCSCLVTTLVPWTWLKAPLRERQVWNAVMGSAFHIRPNLRIKQGHSQRVSSACALVMRQVWQGSTRAWAVGLHLMSTVMLKHVPCPEKVLLNQKYAKSTVVQSSFDRSQSATDDLGGSCAGYLVRSG